MAFTSVFNVLIVFDKDEDWVEEGGTGEWRVNVGDAVEEVRDGVLERIWLAAVGEWRVDFVWIFERDVSRTRGDVIVLVLEVLFVVEVEGLDWLEGGFTTALGIRCWETVEDDDELTLIVDVGLIDRLRDATVDPRYCCDPGAAGRGIKPKRVCMLVGGGGRFVIDIGLVDSKRIKIITTTTIIER